MKKNLNVIRINGIRGLAIALMVVTCLAAGFIVFPGWVWMHLWNFAAPYLMVPAIGLFQGVLLWGIIIGVYLTFRKNKLIICFKTPQGLNEEELKAVFADIKKQSQEDPVLKAMLKAREAELKCQQEKETENSVKSETK